MTGRLTRREAVAGGAGVAVALGAAPAAAAAKPRRRRRGKRSPAPPPLGAGGTPMEPAAIAALAKTRGRGEPIAFVDLAAVDVNCKVLMDWGAANGIAWRPAYKTIQSPDLLAYVVAKLDSPRVMIHHLRNLPQALPVLPAGTDFLMGYPPTVGELAAYLGARPARREKPYTLRINIDSFALLDALLELTKTAKRPAPVDIVLEIDSGGPRGGIQPGADLAEALGKLRAARDRVRVGALLCYDAIAAGEGDPVWRANAARFAQSQLSAAVDQIRATAADFVDVEKLIRNGPGSANYPNWAGGPANEFAAGSAILFANYLDNGFPTAGLHKALYLCAPVLRLPKNAVLDVPHAPAGYQFAFVKAGGWPTGNNPTLSKLVHPPDLQEGPVYGRGANSSGMISAPVGSLALGDYVVETCQQVMEGQNYFGALHAARDGSVRRLWPVVSRWSGRRMEV